MAILTPEPLDEEALRREVRKPSCGAVASFAGVVRDRHEGREVEKITYEAAPALALAALEKIEREAREKFAIEEIAIAHRVGLLEVGEASVVIAVGAAHRAAAFEACRWAIDRLKAEAPIWKKEHFSAGGSAWAQGVKLEVKPE